MIYDLLIQVTILICIAPFISGLINKLKSRIQNRKGPSIFQLYYDIYKLLNKDSVISPTVSWIFTAAPYIYFAGTLTAICMLPLLIKADYQDLFLLLGALALGRFFLVLAGMDAGSAFGGIGSSREVYISILMEPVIYLAFGTLALFAHSSNMVEIVNMALIQPLQVSGILAATAFFIILIAETGRIPVDNPDTHLELTMIHEAMILEYSGRKLGLIIWANSIKQLLFIVLFAQIFIPWVVVSSYELPLKIIFIVFLIVICESFTNKMRLFRIPGFASLSAVLSLLALVAY